MGHSAKNMVSDDCVAKVNKVKDTFDTWVEKSISTTYESLRNDDTNQTTPLMAYLLVSCAIDFIAGFYCGRKPRNRNNKSGKEYRMFVKDFMPNYDAEVLYKDLRCALAHNFALGESLALTHNKRWLHLKYVGGKILINFEDFYSDFKNGAKKYFERVHKEKQLQELFLSRFDDGGIVDKTGVDITWSELTATASSNNS